MNSLLPIDYWRQVFQYEFQQVENVKVYTETDSLDVYITGQKEVLKVTAQELNKSLHEVAGNPYDVAFAFLKKHKALVFYQETLAAFFDIQAYSAFIDRTDFKEAVWKINDLLSSVKTTSRTDFGPIKFDSWILSDSIILVIDTNRCPLHSGSINLFFFTCATIMYQAMSKGFPLRGAIGGGDFYKDGGMMVSSALVDAARYEKEQNWFGAVLTPNAHALVEKTMKFKTTFNGKTDIDFTWDYFKASLRYGVIPWKKSGSSLMKHHECYYIKPYQPFQAANSQWASRLPDYFEDRDDKIKKSEHLYARNEMFQL